MDFSSKRIARLNALDAALIDALRGALEAIEADSFVRAVILTGAGDRAFSAGADIHHFGPVIEQGSAAMRDFGRRGQALTSRIESFPKPLITAVNGLAYGGGCEIVEAAALAVAAVLSATTRGLNLPIDAALAVEAAAFERMLPTADIREGIAAFREKRAPRFHGG